PPRRQLFDRAVQQLERLVELTVVPERGGVDPPGAPRRGLRPRQRVEGREEIRTGVPLQLLDAFEMAGAEGVADLPGGVLDLAGRLAGVERPEIYVEPGRHEPL